MEVQSSEFHGTQVVYIWLSKQENNDVFIKRIVDSIKKEYRVCIFNSGTVPSEEILKRMILET